MQGAQVQPLVRELRSRLPHGAAKKTEKSLLLLRGLHRSVPSPCSHFPQSIKTTLLKRFPKALPFIQRSRKPYTKGLTWCGLLIPLEPSASCCPPWLLCHGSFTSALAVAGTHQAHTFLRPLHWLSLVQIALLHDSHVSSFSSVSLREAWFTACDLPDLTPPSTLPAMTHTIKHHVR